MRRRDERERDRLMQLEEPVIEKTDRGGDRDIDGDRGR